MPTVCLILEDNNGVTTEHRHELLADLAKLDRIDEAVEPLRLRSFCT